jgi:ABC-type transport system involved in cytochrome c biogenesis permease subunit
MKKLFTYSVVLGGVLAVALSLLPPRKSGAFDVAAFGRLPVLANGRVKPLDTVARSSLLQLQGRQLVRNINVKNPVVASPTEWLLDVFYRPDLADTYQTFLVEHLEQADVMAVIGRTPESLKIEYNNAFLKTLAIADMVPKTQRRFSFNDLSPRLKEIEDAARLAAPVEGKLRTPFQSSVLSLYANLRTYLQLRHAAVVPGRPEFLNELIRLQENLPAMRAAVTAKLRNEAHDEAAVASVMALGQGFDTMSKLGTLLLAPPDTGDADITRWQTAGHALMDTFQTGRVNTSALAYAGLGQAWRAQKPAEFNKLLELFSASLVKRYGPQLDKSAIEARFNAAAPFYLSIKLYAWVFFLGIGSWLLWPEAMRRSAFGLLTIAWVVTTAGIITRMWLEERPPVTNLYSSALYIGWGAVGLCIGLEKIYRNAIAAVAAGVIGFGTLIIAHHLSLSGDTLELMEAVLDTNIWLATHVVIVTTGYAATFLAGFLGLLYIVLGVATPLLGRPFDRQAQAAANVGAGKAGRSAAASSPASETIAGALNRMVYGIVCFATLCSFVGTVLGGIWADQSWGRFWGWDPKENGALLIVLWNAIILHSRWAGLIKQRGLMVMAVFGNIVTSWSWFGTNMLGIGLHSYGFTGAAFVALMIFMASQAAFMLLGAIPLEKWRSFRAKAATSPVEELESATAK